MTEEQMKAEFEDAFRRGKFAHMHHATNHEGDMAWDLAWSVWKEALTVGYEMSKAMEETIIAAEQQHRECEQLRFALGEYAHPQNWALDSNGVRRMWLMPESSSPDRYDGNTIAETMLRKLESE